jgi:hypothetical protein
MGKSIRSIPEGQVDRLFVQSDFSDIVIKNGLRKRKSMLQRSSRRGYERTGLLHGCTGE